MKTGESLGFFPYLNKSVKVINLGQIVDFFDLLRIKLLRLTMPSLFFRTIYQHRPYRLTLFFIGSLVFNLFLSFNFPLWSLLLGPLILGGPHLLSSMRYLPKFLTNSDSEKNFLNYKFVGGTFLVLTLSRLIFDQFYSSILSSYPFLLESMMSLFVFFCIVVFTPQSKINLIRGLAYIFLLFYSLFNFPLFMLGFFVLAHNFVAFLFWFKRSRFLADKLAALFALTVFSAISLFILLGLADRFLVSNYDSILSGTLDVFSLGSQILSSSDLDMPRRLITIYALGQGLHYFVWLKAIPELELSFMHTTSFKQSYDKLKKEMSSRFIYGLLILILALILYGAFVSWPMARVAYLYLAAFHGYFELTSLVFVKEKI